MLANSLQSLCPLLLYYIWEPPIPPPTSLQLPFITVAAVQQVLSLYDQFYTLEMLTKARR